MIKHLEDLLYEKTRGTQSDILFAQWNYDKKVIPNALNAVSVLFPHYSLHDESHSITIINNIVRVLGIDNIKKLSAIDIWLILEASYCHDLGMVVSSEKLVESITSQEFIDFFREIMQDSKDGLHEFANQFDLQDNKIKYKLSDLNLELHDGIKFILAEYFRRKHSDRSKDIIINPIDELNITTPRGVIPQRIFKILGDICSSHTKNFNEVMDLPFCEVGIDIEDAHPRFISCLLRIGDLLDLDNNRFSDVMLRTLSKIPVDTLKHKSKHLSIESFRVDTEIIEVFAKCSDYDTANITQHWFNYLNNEISDQMIRWNNIVPFKDLGYLPTIGNLKVELADYDYIDGKNKPQFAVDTDKALELLKGAGIYEGAYQCIREILQNSVDATLKRIWLEHGDNLDLSTPQSSEFQEIVKNYPIEIKINETKVIGDKKIWKFSVVDNGIGISSNDLSYLMKTGSSSKNLKNSSLVDSMPIWLRPSGTFGIGFQSIFMLTDQVNIDTKSFFNEEFQTIELNSPNSRKNGGILIQKKKTSHKVKPGSKIQFNYKIKAIPDRWTIKGDHINASNIAHNYDPFSHDSLDVEIGKILDETIEFSFKSYIPIVLRVNNEVVATKRDDSAFKFFDKENSLEFNLHYGKIENSWRTVTFYKNQEASNKLKIRFFGFQINIHKEKASEVLTLNRNEIRADYESELRKQILLSAFTVITSKYDEIFTDDTSKGIGSMFLNYYRDEYSFLNRFNVEKFDHWRKLKLNMGSQAIDFKQLLNIESFKIIYNKSSQQRIGESFSLNKDKKELTLNLDAGGPIFDYTYFLLRKISKRMSSISDIKDTDVKKEIIFSKKNQKGTNFEEHLINVLKSTKNGYSSRCIIPCIDKYLKLRLKDQAHISYVNYCRFDYLVDIAYPQMLSPFITIRNDNRLVTFELALNERMLNWVFENRYDIKTTFEEIKNEYKNFSEYYTLEKINKHVNA